MSGSGRRTRVLVVDDEPNITAMLATTLRFTGFDVATAADGREALAAVRKSAPDVVLLDLMLPDMDGFTVSRRLREAGMDAPVLFLTARAASADKVRGLTEGGGDDYVTKPFDLDELVARVNVLARRRSAPREERRLRVGPVELDGDTREVRRDGELVPLSPTEYDLLHFLLANAGRVVTKAQILDAVWHSSFQGESGVVETYVYYVRRKLGDTDQKLIRTVRGVGYLVRAASPDDL